MSEERIIRRRRKADKRANPPSDIQPMELDPAFNYFMSAKIGEGIRKRTQTDYSNTWRYFTDWLYEENYNVKYVHEISTEICRNYILYLTVEAPRFKGHKYIQTDQGKGLSTATINMRIRALKVAFNFWYKEGFVRKNPMDNIRCQKEDEDKIESFTDEQIEALLGACDQRTYVGFRDYVFQWCLLDTAMRINELLSIAPEDIDIKTRSIELAAHFNKNRRARIVPVSAETIKLLHELIDENKAHFPYAKKVFLSVYGEEVKDTQMNKRLKYYGDITGVSKEIRTTAHTWRHTSARNYILNGGDPYTLMRLLGHSSIAMTRRYVQMTPEDVRIKHEQFSPIKKFRTKLR
ncbi:tyrosine-type recombinase/integrase [Bacillus swezeyi]|uniref:Integrase n=1 Tax=Bacillus swezeyi TaxID=1925020 RepID=A0A5M8RUK3_9BACI|nr:tyrosine-type recombinase/integrase [Bacillus swezeyi]KAA6450524.1 integrase [Bacillus swezeyi]TYS37060.1 tyrosine-type recombinase/integrase [Bacillus swezeyi]